MKETEQTLLEKCKDAIAYKEGYENWTECRFKVNSTSILLLMDQVAEMYATAKAKASCEATLKKASEKAVVRGYCAGCERAGLLHCAHADSCGSNVVIVDKSSINHPSNIVIL